MMKGRKPKAREIRQAEGNPGKRPLPEPVHVDAVYPGQEDKLEAPEHLPAVAKEWWRETIPTLAGVGLLDTVDRGMLEMAATAYARHRQAGRILAVQGHLTRGSVGQLREHPSMATERAAAATYERIAEQFGLTPIARTRMGLAELSRKKLKDELVDSFGRPDLIEVDGEVIATEGGNA